MALPASSPARPAACQCAGLGMTDGRAGGTSPRFASDDLMYAGHAGVWGRVSHRAGLLHRLHRLAYRDEPGGPCAPDMARRNSGKHDSCHGGIVRGFDQRHGVVVTKTVVEVNQLSPEFLAEETQRLSSVLWILGQCGQSLGGHGALVHIEWHGSFLSPLGADGFGTRCACAEFAP